MENRRFLIGGFVVAVVIFSLIETFSYKNKVAHEALSAPNNVVVTKNEEKPTVSSSNDPTLVGPRDNVPADAPNDKGFKMFAVPVPGTLSRSGQPTIADFQWLKNNGWKSVVDLRVDGEKSDISMDNKIPGFNDLGFNFLSIPITDGSVPTDAQGDEFLKFVTDPANQPAHVHCAAGIGRTGIMTALYRYSVQSWPMDKAIQEDAMFTKSINKTQQDWLHKWASSHNPGDYAKK